MRAKRAIAALLAMHAAPLASSAEPITAANPQQHPAIVEIEAIHAEIRGAETAGRLRKEHRQFGYCQAYEDSERTLYLDENGAVRSYRVGRGSEHSAAQLAYYYDRSGALRFVFANWEWITGP